MWYSRRCKSAYCFTGWQLSTCQYVLSVKKEEIKHSMQILTPNIKLFHSVLILYITPQTNQSLGTSKLDVKSFHSVKNPLIFCISVLTQPDVLVRMFFNWPWVQHERIHQRFWGYCSNVKTHNLQLTSKKYVTLALVKKNKQTKKKWKEKQKKKTSTFQNHSLATKI